MKFLNKFLIINSLLCLTWGALAADNSASKSDLSATTTESYQIRNQKFGELLRPQDASSANGTPIVLYPATLWKCMTWKLAPAGESGFHVQNHFTSKTFIAKEGKNVVQTPYTQTAGERPTWRFTKQADGSYQIAEAKSGEVLTAVSEGGSVHIVVAPWQDKAEQKWEMIKTDPAKLVM